MSVAIFTSALDKTHASEWPFTLFLTFFFFSPSAVFVALWKHR